METTTAPTTSYSYCKCGEAFTSREAEQSHYVATMQEDETHEPATAKRRYYARFSAADGEYHVDARRFDVDRYRVTFSKGATTYRTADAYGSTPGAAIASAWLTWATYQAKAMPWQRIVRRVRDEA